MTARICSRTPGRFVLIPSRRTLRRDLLLLCARIGYSPPRRR